MTNGDKIRQMSDEEILEFFYGSEAYTVSMPIQTVQIVNGAQFVQTTTLRYIDWMKQDAE